jgi:formylglycine-generating enzyme required for sulfatase activity
MAKLSKGIAKLSTLATLMISLTLRCTPATTRYYTEPLDDLGEAIPLQMLLIPAGTFTMGSPEDEPERSQNEAQHEVTVPPFFLGRYPVTQAQWRAVAALPQVKRAIEPAPSHFKGDNRPVEQVSWYEAVEFCDRLQQHTGRPYRLPSEAEWEYACRAGTTSSFHFGQTLTTEVANYDGNHTYADGPKGEYRKETTPVDQFDVANAFGLCDMHGNVWEWCQDQYGDYDQTPMNGGAWLTDDETPGRILRGGSWGDIPRFCRAATRSSDPPVFRNVNVGFRVCCAAPRALS